MGTKRKSQTLETKAQQSEEKVEKQQTLEGTKENVQTLEGKVKEKVFQSKENVGKENVKVQQTLEEKAEEKVFQSKANVENQQENVKVQQTIENVKVQQTIEETTQTTEENVGKQQENVEKQHTLEETVPTTETLEHKASPTPSNTNNIIVIDGTPTPSNTNNNIVIDGNHNAFPIGPTSSIALRDFVNVFIKYGEQSEEGRTKRHEGFVCADLNESGRLSLIEHAY